MRREDFVRTSECLNAILVCIVRSNNHPHAVDPPIHSPYTIHAARPYTSRIEP